MVLENSQDRDQSIEQIQGLLEKRDTALADIQPPFSEEEEKLGRQLVGLNKRVLTLLEQEKKAIQVDIKQLRVKKTSTNKYVNPYQSLATDGVFYDKRN